MNIKTGIVLGIVLTLATPGYSKPKPGCDVLPKPPNVIGAPSYVKSMDCPEPVVSEQKLQYRADSGDKPYFERKISPEREESGALYKEGEETYVEPEAPFITSYEPIVEPDEISNETPHP
jgi:hypothetical protein